MMRRIILSLLFIFSTAFYSEKVTASVPDSIRSLNLRLSKIVSTIDSLKIQHDNFEYQKNYFTQALDAQKSVFSDDVSIILTFVAIIFGFVGLFSFTNIYTKIKSIKYEFIKELKQSQELLLKQYNATKMEQEIIRLELYEEKGNVYSTHMNINTDKIEKFVYAIRASKQYLLAKKMEIAIRRIENANLLFREIIKAGLKANVINQKIIFEDLSEIIKILENSETVFEEDKNKIKTISIDIIGGLNQIINNGIKQ